MTTYRDELKLLLGAEDKASPTLAKITKSVVGIGAAYLGWRAAKDLIGDIIEKGMEAEQVWNDVSASLKRHGLAVGDNLNIVKDFAGQMQNTTGISDEVIGTSIQKLVDYGNDLKTSFDLVKTASDLAAGGHMDMMSAIDLVGKASVGYTATLSRYGIIIDDSIPKSQKFAAAIEQINQRFGGAAAARMETTAGKVGLLSEKFGDLEEALYDTFSPQISTLIDAAIFGLDTFTNLLIGDKGSIDSVDELNTSIETTREQLNRLNIAFASGELRLDEYKASVIEATNALSGNYKKSAEEIIALIVSTSDNSVEAQQKLYQGWALGKIGLDDYLAAQKRLDEEMKSKADITADYIETWYETIIDPNILIKYVKAEDFVAVGELMSNLVRQGFIFPETREGLIETLRGFGFTEQQIAPLLTDEIQKALQTARDNIANAKQTEPFSAMLLDDFATFQEGMTERSKETNDAIAENEANALDDRLKAQNEYYDGVEALAKQAMQNQIDITTDMANGMIDVFFGAELEMKKIFQRMAKHFTTYFIDAAIKKTLTLEGSIVSILTSIFDNPINDEKARDQGRHFARYFAEGATSQLRKSNMAGKLSGSISLSDIENEISVGRSRLLMGSGSITGGPDVFFN